MAPPLKVSEERCMLDDAMIPDPYEGLLQSFKEHIAGAQLRAALAVNRELVLLYWQLGREILDQQRRHRWGAKVIDRLARDLRRAFPDQKGFSASNLKN